MHLSSDAISMSMSAMAANSDRTWPKSPRTRACPKTDVVALHTAVTYRVYMLGFLPGFAYMASVDPRLAVPRRATPQDARAAGSRLRIAAGQTGIYPCGDSRRLARDRPHSRLRRTSRAAKSRSCFGPAIV